MTETDDLRNYRPRILVCMVIGILGLGAVPFVGSRWGDVNEMIALAIGVLPILYLVLFAIYNLDRRLKALEQRR